jgi:hypothetical protein
MRGDSASQMIEGGREGGREGEIKRERERERERERDEHTGSKQRGREMER